jgi:hypothetical protein
MLGGNHAPETGAVNVRLGGRWRTSLAGPDEAVELGLPQEYQRVLAVGLSPGIEVTIAAHGPVSSSPVVFEWVAAMLSRLLVDGVPDDVVFLATWQAIRQPQQEPSTRWGRWVGAVGRVESGNATVRCP